MEPLSDAQTVRELIRQCLAGDREASRRFQQSYGELIYGYPMRVYRTPPEDAGDFYVFAFQDGRIFRRLRTFEGRAPFRAYLLGFVLDDLVLEWKRGDRGLDTVSIEEIGELPASDNAMGDEVMHQGNGHPMDSAALNQILAGFEPAKSLVLKLLYAEDCELNAAEICHLVEVSGRSTPEVLEAVDALRATVRDREAALRSLEDALDSVQAWVQLYERRLRRVNEGLNALSANSTTAARLRQEQTELERKIERRRQQRTKLLTQTKRRKVTAPYKDIAALLNTSVGNVGSQIARLREELARTAGVKLREPGKDEQEHDAY